MNPRLIRSLEDDLSASEDRASEAARHLALGKIAEEVNACFAAGKHPQVEDLIREHPDLDSQLRQLLPALATLNKLGQSAASENQPLSDERETSPGRIGDFQIVGELGRGGMGVVYEAEEVSLGRRVALKVLPYAAMLDERQLQRFKNEARIAATLDHPNIVTVHAIGIASGVHYYAMQLIDGLNLADVIKELRHLQSADNGLAVANPSHELANRLSHGNWPLQRRMLVFQPVVMATPNSPLITVCPPALADDRGINPA